MQADRRGDARPRIFPGWWIVLTGYLSQVATNGAAGWVFGVLIRPMEQDLGWSRSRVAGVLTLASLIAGVVGARLGPLVDRHGARWLMTLSAVLAGVCLLLVSRAQTPWQYYLCWAGVGLSMPGLMTLGPGATIANWFIRRRAVAYTVYTLGSATAGIVLAPLIARVAGADWRMGWVVMGVFMLCLAPLAWATIRRRPEDLGLLPDGAPPAATGGTGANPVPAEPLWTAREALRTRTFWLLAVAFALTGLPASSIFIHIVPYVASKGFTAEQGAAVVSVYGLAVLGGRFVWGETVRRIGIRWALVLFAFGYAASIVTFLLPSSLLGIYAVAVLLGIAIAGSQQLNAQAYPDYFGRDVVASLLGFSGVLLTLARAVAPLFAAYVYDATGSYGIAFSVFAAACVIAGAGFLLATPPVPQSQTGALRQTSAGA